LFDFIPSSPQAKKKKETKRKRKQK
jgi:hypothetical protein